MKTNKFLRAVFFTSLFGGTWALAQGCGPSTGGYCNKVCDCQGCNATELDECVDTIDDAKKIAAEEGCDSEFNDLFSCLNNETTCENDKAKADGCDAEATKLAACTPKIVGVGKNACEAYADEVISKYEACGVTVEVGPDQGETQCPDSQAKLAQCLTPCVAGLSCKCIDPDMISAGECTSDVAKPYVDCYSACSGM